MFRGWPPETLRFLRELEDNNEREWFKANRARYDEFVVAPTQALAESLSGLGRTHLFRPWNDTRFHHRPPIKEHVGLAIGYEQPVERELHVVPAGVDNGRTAASLTRALRELGAAVDGDS